MSSSSDSFYDDNKNMISMVEEEEDEEEEEEEEENCSTRTGFENESERKSIGCSFDTESNNDIDDDDVENDYVMDFGLNEALKYNLRLSGFETLEDENYTVYFVKVQVESREVPFKNGPRFWYIKKRYRDFRKLRKQIIVVNGVAPALPSKKYFGNLDPAFIKSRAQGLSKFLWELACMPSLCGLKCTREFLWSDLCVPQTRALLPQTPLMMEGNSINNSSSNCNIGQHSSSMNYFPRIPSVGQSLATMEMIDEEDVLGPMEPLEPLEALNETEMIEQATNDIADAQGRMILTTPEDLQRHFADEGIYFPEDDIMESESTESDNDDGQIYKACTSFMPGLYKWYSGADVNNNSNTKKNKEIENSKKNSSSFCLKGNHSIETPNMDTSHLQRLHMLDTVQYTQSQIDQDDEIREKLVPKLRFVIMLVGSRGDVQPYVALALALKRRGHFVRIAAHECFRNFVKQYKLSFAPLSGDPKDLLRMVTEHSMFSFSFVRQGVTKHRQWVNDLLEDCWDACTLPEERLRKENEPRKREADPGPNVGFGPGFAFAARHSSFRADAVIANPPAFAGWHIAEALGVPLYMSFPMPWSRTGSFPSPFTNAKNKSSSSQLNWMSYGAVDRLIWLGLGDIINSWRVRTLHLHPIWTMSARGHRMIHDNKVPFLYCWSPQILPKPRDWGSHICIPGYWFLDDEIERESEEKAQEFVPNEELDSFLKNGEPPIFIGFGSIVLKNPAKLSKIIVDTIAVLARNHRFVVQAGWTDMDVSAIEQLPEDITKNCLRIGNVPHRWLFERCKCVIHHGGAGTTAEGIRAGKPSVVIPFFGDQFFWARQVKEVRIGVTIPHTELKSKNLCSGIISALSSGTRMRASVLGEAVKRERGTDVAIAFIEKQFLKMDRVRGMQVVRQNSGGVCWDSSQQQQQQQQQQQHNTTWEAENIEENQHWRNWPYVNWGDKAETVIAKPMKAFKGIGKRVKVVGKAIKYYSSSSGSSSTLNKYSDEDPLAVELKSFKHVESAAPTSQLPYNSHVNVPVGHTTFSWKSVNSRKMVGHPSYSNMNS